MPAFDLLITTLFTQGETLHIPLMNYERAFRLGFIDNLNNSILIILEEIRIDEKNQENLSTHSLVMEKMASTKVLVEAGWLASWTRIPH